MSNRNIFKNWEKKASLRNAPLHTLELLDKSRYFSPAVSPLLQLDIISELPKNDIRFVEIQLLYRYLEFTEYLETKLVNPEVLKIANDDYLLGFSQDIKINAYKIYCDEGFHALQAFNMSDQVNQLSGVPPLSFDVELADRLEPLRTEFHPSIQKYFNLFFVAVSECLVSQELNGYIKDKTIHSEIYALMRDHARDEVIHAAFFIHILEFLHDQLGAVKFQYFVEFIPKMLEVYLLPNVEDIKRILEHLLDHSVKSRISSESILNQYSPSFIKRSGSYLTAHVMRIVKNQ